MIRATIVKTAMFLTLVLAGCGGGDSPPPPPPPPSSTSGGSVHYLVQPVARLSLSGQLTANFRLDNPVLYEVQPCGANAPMMRLYFQRTGDNMSGTGEFEHYRWWSQPAKLDGSATTLSASIDPSQWTSVYGKSGSQVPGQFAAAAADVQGIGVTFGGCFAGHGVYGTGTFTMTSFGTLSMLAQNWQFQYSPGMPASPAQTPDGWQFSFPSGSGAAPGGGSGGIRR